MKKSNILSIAAVIAFAAAPFTASAHEGMEGMKGMNMPGMTDSSKTITVTGEVIDMACYVDHGSTGAKHADCAKTCIDSGLPVGLKTADGKVYLLIGAHKPANSELSAYAGKTITVTGKAKSRDGINLLENIKIIK